MITGAPKLEFGIEGAEAVPHSVAPLLALKLHITSTEGATIHSILLRCQVHIEAARRRYLPSDKSKLFDLFGESRDWNRTLRGLLWTTTSMSVPSFTGSITVDLPIACSYDFNLAATKYFDALEDGEVPLSLLFNGTFFYAGANNVLQVGHVPWENEADYRLPVSVWREMMEHYYPNIAWLALRKDVFDRLQQYKREQTLPTWEQTIENLLADASEPAPVTAK
ncbi:MAG TPA: DUF6084 family protein [Lacipirellulaceae bacterium]|nr:DUF6084 family protein [Lacipirellulaceae bacterium]